jgi:hypothetical protein
VEPTKDRQLSRLLREWQVEDAPPALDIRVLSIGHSRRRFHVAHRILAIVAGSRKSLWAAAAVGIAFLVVVTQAIPQTLELIAPPAPPPYTVDSEYVRYADDGSQTVEMYSTSYTNQNGREIILERTIPEHPLGTAVGRTLDAVLPYWSRFTSAVMVSSKQLEKVHQAAAKAVGVISDCADDTCLVLERWFFARAETGPDAPCAAGPVVGHETILGHATTAVMRPMPNPRSTPSRPTAARITMWMAPDLGCFALKLSIEEQRPDGAFRLVSEKRALRVNVKP